uniref:ORF n=1 Tax=La France disease virus TaxID=28373 RepID=Q83035_9VIRU|nr:ORF [La France disease virus]prf//1906228C L3 dsRNA ORF [Agaricus bisporus]
MDQLNSSSAFSVSSTNFVTMTDNLLNALSGASSSREQMAKEGVKSSEGFGQHSKFMRTNASMYGLQRDMLAAMDHSAGIQKQSWVGELLPSAAKLMLQHMNKTGFENSTSVRYKVDAESQLQGRRDISVSSTMLPKTFKDVVVRSNKAMNANFSYSTSGAQNSVQADILSTDVNIGNFIGNSLLYSMDNENQDADMLFTRLWLLHIDIASGSSLTVRMDPSDLEAQMTESTLKKLGPSELLAMHSLEAVVLAGSELSAQGRALVAAACTWRMSGMGTRVKRYKFQHQLFYLTGYKRERVELSDAKATLHVILHLAQRLDATAACSRGLQTAMWLFGGNMPVKSIKLMQSKSKVYERHGGGVSLQGVGMLLGAQYADKAIANLSCYIARAMEQHIAELMHEYVAQGVEADDDDEGTRYLMEKHMGAVVEIKDRWVDVVKTYLCPAVNWLSYIIDNMASIWIVEGRELALALGMLVAGGVTEMMAVGINLPERASEHANDDPYWETGKQNVRAWWLANQLAKDSGKKITHTLKVEVRGVEQIPLIDHIDCLVGQKLKYVFIGFGKSTLYSGEAFKVTMPAQAKKGIAPLKAVRLPTLPVPSKKEVPLTTAFQSFEKPQTVGISGEKREEVVDEEEEGYVLVVPTDTDELTKGELSSILSQRLTRQSVLGDGNCGIYALERVLGRTRSELTQTMKELAVDAEWCKDNGYSGETWLNEDVLSAIAAKYDKALVVISPSEKAMRYTRHARTSDVVVLWNEPSGPGLMRAGIHWDPMVRNAAGDAYIIRETITV